MRKKLIYLTVLALVFCIAGNASAELVAYWNFDEEAGTVAADLSGNGHDGTLNGDTTWVAGQFGNALQFDGSGDYVNCGTGVSFTTIGDGGEAEGYTITVWINPADPGGDGKICGDIDDAGWSAAGGLKLGLYQTRIESDIRDSSGRFFSRDAGGQAGLALEANTWYHVVVVFDDVGDTYTEYVNGAISRSISVTQGVAASTADFRIGTDTPNLGHYFNGLVDDLRIYDFALTVQEILDVMAGRGPQAEVASEPIPEDEATDVSREVILSWTPGRTAHTHDIYLGMVFNDVNDADRDNPLDVLLIQGHDTNTYEPGRLELGRMYYWRVDEVNAPPDSTIYPGEVWSFTVEPFSYPIQGENITVIASSNEEGKEPENVINGSGLDESGLLHANIGEGNMWLSSRDGEQPSWIEFEFDKVYKLYEMWVWNSNDSLEPVIGLGFKDVNIEYSADGNDYTTLGTTHEFAQASGDNDYAHNNTVEFDGAAAKYVKLTASSNWGGILNQYGLSEVRFFYKPVHAKEPIPASGATGVTLEPILGWRAGREAAEHSFYFSDDQQAVIDGTANMTTVSDASYGPLDLDLGRTYYWRVDEVNNTETPGTWQGEVWDFTTIEYFVVDDFEDYNDYEPDRIFDTWIDGWNIATNGSTIGYAEPVFTAGEHFVETSVVHSGSQSMPYFYDNSVGNSEATMTLSSRRNWTEKGVGSLTLWFRGNPAGFVEDPIGTYTIDASGTDIWGTADEFRYVYKQLSGAGSIIARVESLEDTDPWAKAGVMIRQTLEPDSKFAGVYVTPGNGCRFQARLATVVDATSDTDVATTEQIAITAPYWVRIDRDASDNFNGYYSSDGVNWVAMAWNPQNIAMPADVYIGLAVTSHNVNETCTAVLSGVETTGIVSPQVWTQQAIGADMPSNQAVRMYVVLDSSAVVYHDNPDASQIDEWTEWNIDLQDFADKGVDLTDVDSLGIGFGDRDNPQPGGAGVVYFDDIRLYPLLSEPVTVP